MPIDPLDHSVTEALRAWRVQHSAGIDVSSSLNQCAQLCRDDVARGAFQNAAQRATSGEGHAGMLDALRPALNEAERAVINAGWQSGRVESVLDSVVSQRELWADARRKMRAKLALPLLVLIMAAFVAPLPHFILGGTAIEYLFSALMPLGIAYLVWRMLEKMIATRNSTLDGLLLELPVISSVEKTRSLSEFASVLSILVGAGTSISTALEICARAASNSIYGRDISRCAAIIGKGNTLTSALQPGKLWPPEFIAVVEVGEKSGTLEESLARFGRQARERYVDAVEAFAAWIPRLLYGLVALFIIAQIGMLVAGLAGAYSGVLR